MLTSLQNPLVKEFRKLHQSRERQLRQLLLLEGTNLVESAIAKGFQLETVLITAEWADRHPELLLKLGGDRQGIRVVMRQELITEDILQKVATTVNPDGIVATLNRQQLQYQPPERLQLGIALERLQDPGNLGTIIRTAAATGVDALLLSDDSVNPENPKVLRASVGAWFQAMPIVTRDFTAQIQQYKAQGVQIVATLPQATKTYWDLDWQRPSLILLGNEGAGLSKSVAALADETVTIPMVSGVESLNAAIACSLLLYEAQRQKYQGKPPYQFP